MEIEKRYYTNNPCYNQRATCSKIGIQVHSIGCAQDDADVLYNVMNQPTYMAGVHYLVDAKRPGKVIQTMPESIRSWADGGYGNDHLISFEILESKSMIYSGGASFAVANADQFQKDVLNGFNTAVELCADICSRYGWNPLGKLPSGLYVISSHDEGRKAGLSTAHVDPTHMWSKAGMDMDKFRKAVAEKMKKLPEAPKEDPVIQDDKGYWYRVQLGAFKNQGYADALLQDLKQEGYKDAFLKKVGEYWKVQIGAFTMQENAEKLCQKMQQAGYSAFVTKDIVQKETYKPWVGKVTTGSLNVRTGPGVNYPIFADYPELKDGNLVDVLEESGEWYKIRIAGKYEVFAHSDYIGRF